MIPPNIGPNDLERILNDFDRRLRAAKPFDSGWVDITLNAGFGDLTGFGWNKPQYLVTGIGSHLRIDFRGLINRTGALSAANVVYFTMAAGLRPPAGQIFNMRSSVGTAEVSVFATGEVRQAAAMATNVWSSLDGLYYYLD